jgi:hypothetical protein
MDFWNPEKERIFRDYLRQPFGNVRFVLYGIYEFSAENSLISPYCLQNFTNIAYYFGLSRVFG